MSFRWEMQSGKHKVGEKGKELQTFQWFLLSLFLPY